MGKLFSEMSEKPYNSINYQDLNVNQTNNDATTALTLRIQNSNVDIVRRLLEGREHTQASHLNKLGPEGSTEQ